MPEIQPGVKKFGLRTYTSAPKSHPPTLTIYTGHPAVDEKEIELPPKLRIVKQAW